MSSSINPSGIQPTGFNVLILPIEVQEKTTGGLYIPDTTKEKEEFSRTKGRLVATSPVAFDYAAWPKGAKRPEPGDEVYFARYNGTTLTGEDGKDYLLVNDQAVAAVIGTPTQEG